VNYIEYFLYCFAVVITIATPGPVMLLVASAGLKGGYRRALQTIFGTNLASLVLIAASIAILKGFLTISEQWFNVV
jgi:threonine/homoserine/homoserine lactone efflux protein